MCSDTTRRRTQDYTFYIKVWGTQAVIKVWNKVSRFGIRLVGLE